MNKPDVPKAEKRVSPDGETGLGMQLKLWVEDPDVLAELRQREGAQRDQYALTALRVGVIALRQAGGLVDAEQLKSEGVRILSELETKLSKHATDLDAKLGRELERYFDPTNGSFPQRVAALTSDSGELSGLLKQHIGGDSSVLAQQLAKAVGESSPLMKHLRPTEKDGLIDTLTRIAEERLQEQSAKVLGEFDLNNPKGALNRLIAQIETNFNPDNPKTALGVLTKALRDTQERIRKDLTLDVADDGTKSPLSKMQDSLLEKIAEIADQQVEFQKSVSQQLGIKQVQARTTEGGFSFEHLAAEALKQRVISLGDEFQSVGELPGVLKRLTGDHVQILGAESAVPGASIVYECKRDKSYRVKKAREELEEARKNRDSSIGVFIMSAQTLRDNEGLRSEYPAAMARYESDIIAVWDSENPASDVVLDAAISLARALVVRAAHAGHEDDAKELQELNEAIADIEKQFERFDKMSRWCDGIMETAKDISGKAFDLQEELRKVLKRLKSDVKSLNEGLISLKNEPSA
jgi:hypothetical protein